MTQSGPNPIEIINLYRSAEEHHRAGRLSQAEPAYRRLIELKGDHAGALHGLGILAHQTGHHAHGIELIRRAVEVEPANAQYRHNLGIVFKAAGRTDEAIAAFRQTLAMAPGLAEAHNNLGVALRESGSGAEAMQHFREAVALKPAFGEALNNVAISLNDERRFAEAVPILQQVIALDPQHAMTWSNLAYAMHELGRHTEAIKCGERALLLQPDLVAAHFNLARSLSAASRPELAEPHFHFVLVRHPDFADAYDGLGLALLALRRNAEAMKMFRRALELNAKSPAYLVHVARAHRLQGLMPEAISTCEQALQRDPNLADAHLELAKALLASAHLSRGWAEYAWRHRAGDASGNAALAREWDGVAVKGENLLVRGEGNLDDEIRYAGMLPDLCARLSGDAMHLTVQCAPQLAELFRVSFAGIGVVASASRDVNSPESGTSAGAQIAIGSLARSLRGSLAEFPRRDAGYLMADGEGTAKWKARLAGIGAGCKIGLLWKSGERSGIALEAWTPILELEGAHFIALDGGASEREIAGARQRFGVVVHRFEGIGLDAAADARAAREMAAFLCALDLVIAMPGPEAALAAALGVETWEIRETGDWHALGCARDPWFPNLTVIEQRWDEAPEAVLAQIGGALIARLGADKTETVPGGALFDLGLRFHQIGMRRTAAPLYRAARGRNPGHASALHCLGLAEFQDGDAAGAERTIGQAIALDPESATMHSDLGVVLTELDRSEDAASAYRQALALRPDFPEALNNLGSSLKTLGRIDEAVAQFRAALALRPGYADALHNLGMGLELLGEREQAIEFHRQAVRLNPDYLDARFEFAQALLRAGKLTEGWREFEHRHDSSIRGTLRVAVRELSAPVWDGSPLTGKTLLIQGEQGIGDEIWLSSLYGELIERAARVVIECHAKLVPLFAISFPTAEVLPRMEPVDPRVATARADYRVAAGSLPRLLRANMAAFPRRRFGHLIVDGKRLNFWREKIAALGEGPKIGISWRSSVLKGARKLHCSRLEEWGALLRVPGVQFVSLQYDDCIAELDAAGKAFGVPLHRFPELDMFNDIADTAAMMLALDRVISAPTMVAVLSGALGQRTWQLSYGDDWQQLGQPENPWYPQLKTFVRRWNEGWPEVLGRVAGDLVKETRQAK